jgi:hypothetical protein
MRVVNIHERVLDASADRVGQLIDGLASAHDRLWPHDRWPAMRFDRPLGVSASGGHGPIGYVVESYTPGRRVQFRFTKPTSFVGTHRFDVEPIEATRTKLRHTIEMQTTGLAWLTWAIAIRPLHDALLEDLLDRADAFTDKEVPSRKWSPWVRFLRWVMRPRRTRKSDRS